MVTIAEIDKQQWWEYKKKFEKLESLEKRGNIFKGLRGGILGENEGEFYILSIIDILTVFEMKKKF